MSKIGIVIEREYLERVKKKSFIVTTILMPVLMLVLMALPTLIVAFGDKSSITVTVIDNTGAIFQQLESSKELAYRPTEDATVDSALTRNGTDAVLVIPANTIVSPKSNLRLFANGPISISVESDITSQINAIVENLRLKSYNIDNLDKILEDVKSNVSMTTIRTDKESEENTSSMLSYFIGIGMTFVLYMFLLIYGQMVMTSIIEEKGNRVLELVVSSVKPVQLMMGKITGIALVAVTQIVIWGILMSVMSTFLLPALLPADIAAEAAAVQAGNIDSVEAGSVEVLQAIGMLGDVGYILSLFGWMTLFLVLGFLMYSSIFAAVGSAVDNIQDASQLTTLAMVPIMFGLIFAIAAATDPMGQLAFWASIFPLTSPMVMMARVPFGIPTWEILLSLTLLAGCFVALVWLAGKIYRVGIFMYGKKPSVKELIRWINYK